MSRLTEKQKALLSALYVYGEITEKSFHHNTVASLIRRNLIKRTDENTIVLADEPLPYRKHRDTRFSMCPRCGQYNYLNRPTDIVECPYCEKVTKLV